MLKANLIITTVLGCICGIASQCSAGVVYNSAQLETAIQDMNAGRITWIGLYPHATFQGTFTALTNSSGTTKTIKTNHATLKAVVRDSVFRCVGCKNVRFEGIRFERTLKPVSWDDRALLQAHSGAESIDVTNCDFLDVNYTEAIVDSFFADLTDCGEVSFQSCQFGPKASKGDMVYIVPTANSIDRHQITDCIFKDFNSSSLGNNPGATFIRIGGSASNTKMVECTVADNTFQGFHVSGETEMISNKSGGNRYERNVFFDCEAALTLRVGSWCHVLENYFTPALNKNDNGFSGKNSSIRVHGYGHRIVNNYIHHAAAGNYSSAIVVGGGGTTGYDEADSCLISYNTIVDSRSPIIFQDTNQNQTDFPVNNYIESNLVYLSGVYFPPTNAFIEIDPGWSEVADKADWESNYFKSNFFAEDHTTLNPPLVDAAFPTWSNHLQSAAAGSLVENNGLPLDHSHNTVQHARAGTVYVPLSTSDAVDNDGSQYTKLLYQTDIDGLSRGSSADVGAHEVVE